MVSLNELKKKIRRDAAAYDNLAKQYNVLVAKERKAGRLLSITNGRLIAANTASGKAASKRVITSWNKLARKGQKLKSELNLFVQYQNRVKARALKGKTSRRKTAYRR